MKKIISSILMGCAAMALPAQTNGETPSGSTAQETLGSGRLAEIKVHGSKLSKFNPNQFKYIYNVFYQESKEYKDSCITVKTFPGDSATVAISYNPATRIAEVKSTAVVGDSTKTYQIKFSRLFHQLEDASFEKYTEGNEPLYGWHSFASARGPLGALGFMSPQPESVEGGANGSKRAVRITSKDLGLAKANGNMTTGAINMGNYVPTDASNYNFTLKDSLSNNLAFQGKPDSVVFYAKFKAGQGNSGKCGNANFILHKDGEYRDPEIDSLKNLRIAKASQLIAESNDWVKYTVPFVYDKDVKGSPKNLLASVTTNPVPGESAGDTLYFDEVKFIYNSKLSALTVKGAKFDFHPDTLNYDLRGSHYLVDSVAFTQTGVGSYVNKKFDKASGLYTFTVKGNDYTTCPENITVYTLQFDLPDTVGVKSIKVFGEALADFNVKKADYIVLNKDYEEGCIDVEVADKENTSVEVAYSPATRCATITVVALKGGETKNFRVKFDQALYQFEDASFEKYTEGIEPLYGWNSFNSATGVMAPFGKGLSPNPESVADGANGSKRSVMLHSKNVILANANGNMTTGIINMGSYIPTDASNHNFTDTTSLNNKFRFAGRPDSVIFYAKFKADSTNLQRVGRAQFILHDDCQYKDPEDSTQLASRIGKATQLIGESKEWKKYVVPFVYDKEQTETQYLLASVTTNPVPGESQKDTLYFDEVTFVYDHAIAGFYIEEPGMEGEAFEIKADVFEYDFTGHVYNPDFCKYEVKGAGATTTEVYDAATGVLTVTVKGNDFIVNPNSVSTYTFKFDISTGIEGIENINGNVNVYDINGRTLRVNAKAATALEGLPAGVYIVNGKKVVK